MKNIIEKVQELSYQHRNLYSVMFDLLSGCNWECKHCYIPNHDNNKLPIEQVKKTLNDLRRMGVFEVTFTGGEIFCRDDIMDIIKYARSLFFNVILFTNVSLLNENIIQKLSELCIGEISCTIFSLDPEIHDFITGISGSLDKAMKNIVLIKKYHIPLTIKTIVTNVNFRDSRTLKQFCEENGFFYKIDYEVFSQTDGNASPRLYRMTETQLELELPWLDSLRMFTPKKHNNSDYVCPGIQNAVAISHDGNVYPCNKMLIPIGNIYEDSIDNIWYNSPILTELQNLQWGQLIECGSCNKNIFCKHCPGIALLEDGNICSASSLSCDITKVRAKIYKEKDEFKYEKIY